MAKFGKSSLARLETVHKDLQIVFKEVIKYFDCTVVFGHRSPEKQNELYQQGRTTPGSIVTYKDGYEKLSKHNHSPSLAVDVVPYPIDWGDTDRMRYFAGFVMGIAKMLKEQGKIENNIVWGADWDGDTELNDQKFVDIPHFQIKK
jgi:peptidoglycan L-alanyl-D-glutamate endopeptidase CwlK